MLGCGQVLFQTRCSSLSSLQKPQVFYFVLVASTSGVHVFSLSLSQVYCDLIASTFPRLAVFSLSLSLSGVMWPHCINLSLAGRVLSLMHSLSKVWSTHHVPFASIFALLVLFCLLGVFFCLQGESVIPYPLIRWHLRFRGKPDQG